MANKENKEIIQSYLLTAARYQFSVDEKRVLTHLVEKMQDLLEGKHLLGKIETDLFKAKYFEVPTNFFFSEGVNRKRIKDALLALKHKEIIYEENDVWKPISIIQGVVFDQRKGNIGVLLCQEIIDVFLNFNKGYSKYMLDVSLSFKSVYSMRLYELISNQQAPLTFRISKLKEMWQVTEKSYDRNYNFIQKIIEQAKKELDEKSNWSFTYRPIKRGRSFELIEFTPIHYQERETEEQTKADLMRRLHLSQFVDREVRNYLTLTCGFSPREIKNNANTIKAFCERYQDARERITDIWGRARSVKNPKGYLINSIKGEIKELLT